MYGVLARPAISASAKLRGALAKGSAQFKCITEIRPDASARYDCHKMPPLRFASARFNFGRTSEYWRTGRVLISSSSKGTGNPRSHSV